MKKIAIITLAMLSFATSFAELSRQITQTIDIGEATVRPWDVVWFSGESVELEITSIHNRDVYTGLTNDNVVVVWEVFPVDNLSNAYFTVTGSVVNATNAETYYYAPIADAVLNGPNDYVGFVRALQIVGGSVSNLAILAKQDITVKGSPTGLEYTYIPVLTNFVAQTIDIVSVGYTNWNEAFSWGDHAGLYPLIGTYNTATDALWTAISAATPGGYTTVSNYAVTAYGWGDHSAAGYATGTPLYAYSEIDPIWTAASGAVYQAISDADPTNIVVTSPNVIQVQELTNSITTFVASGAGSAVCNGTYTRSNGSAGQSATYTNANAVLVQWDGIFGWTFNNILYFEGAPSATDPWDATFSTSAGTNPAPTVVQGTTVLATHDLETIGGQVASGITTNFTFLSATDVTGQCWFASGILTNLDTNIGD